MILFRFFNIEGNGHLNLNFKFLKMKLKCHIFKYVKRSKNLFIMSLSLTIQPHQKSRFLEIFSWILNMFAIVSTDFFCCNHRSIKFDEKKKKYNLKLIIKKIRFTCLKIYCYYYYLPGINGYLKPDIFRNIFLYLKIIDNLLMSNRDKTLI